MEKVMKQPEGKDTLRVILQIGVVMVVALFVTACSRAHASTGTKVELSTKGDQLAFTQTELQVQAGERVLLTFTNSSKALQHNWVLVKGGEPVAQQVSNAALAAGLENGLQLPDQTAILANSPLAQSGERVEIAFTAPTEPGAYTYLCTFPGHFLVGMKGTLVVKP